ncbi:MAG TPA: biopolymer transporter ExbD [Myxococcaceae bacterium]|nr:biopolymer transporter ExbD [Myxococcaceae bacterium]
MAFYFSKRKLRPKEEEEAGELNIVPYLDILMNLIIFMLLSMTGLAAFGILNVNAPNYGGPSAGANMENPDTPKLLLTVLISKKGFYVAGAGAVLGSETAPGEGEPTVGKKGEEYDFASLTAKMVQIKGAFPKETKVIVGAEADIPYETLIQTMDSIRETGGGNDRKILFSDVTLAAM